MKQTIINKFNEILKPLTSNSDNISSILNQNTNLKLHDIVYLNEFNYDEFQIFCEVSFQEWEKFLDEHNLIPEYIGNTSRFYLNSKHYDMFNYEYNGKINARNLIKLICQNSGIDLDYIKVDDNGDILNLEEIKFSDGTSSGWEEYFLETCDLNSYYQDLENEVERFFEEFKEIKTGYQYLENFKNNQVSIYKDFFGFAS